MRRHNSISVTLTRRNLGIDDPHEYATRRVTTLLEHGWAVDSRRKTDGTWTHGRAINGRSNGGTR